MKRLFKIKMFFLLLLVMTIFWSSSAFADVNPGDVITRDNWQKVQGMVPDFLLNDIKNGQWELKIGELKFNRQDFLSAEEQRDIKNPAAAPKFAIDANSRLVAAGGKPYAVPISSRPFPVLDPQDPQAGLKLMYNWWFNYFSNVSEFIFTQQLYNVDKKGMGDLWLMDNWYAALHESGSPYDFGRATLFVKPAANAGIASYTTLTLDKRNEKIQYLYLPDTRAMRRIPGDMVSSEDPYGWNLAPDDQWPGGTQVNVFDTDYKVVAVKEMLAPYMSDSAIPSTDGKNGGILLPPWDIGAPTGKSFNVALGIKNSGWKGAPWAVTNAVWCKVTAYEIEYKVKPTVSGYRYGVCRAWVDPVTSQLLYKSVAHIGSNKFFKGIIHFMQAGKTPSGRAYIYPLCITITNYERDHATVSTYGNGEIKAKAGMINPKIFTKTGFTELQR